MLGGPVREIVELTHNAGNAATGGIWRLQLADRSVVLKLAQPPRSQPVGTPGWQTSDRTEHWNYWRREAEAYRSGFAAVVYADAGITAPELIHSSTRDDGSIVLWLQYVDGVGGTTWSIEQLGAFARKLGQAQGRWLNAVPDLAWLSSNWLAGYLADRQVPAAVPWDEPTGAVWPRELRQGLRAIWNSRDRLVKLACAAPRTLCHLDVWPMNLIQTADATVLLDWAFVGAGAVGEDPANLIVDSVADGLIDAALLPDIEAAVIAGYLAGLRLSGCRLDEAAVRRTIAASGAAKYSWLAPAMLSRAAAAHSVGDTNYGTAATTAEVFASRTGLLNLLVGWAELALGG